MQVLVIITFIASIAAMRNLSAPKTEIRFIEDLRFDTRSPGGWILLLTLFAMPLTILALVARFLDVQFLNSKTKIILIIVSSKELSQKVVPYKHTIKDSLPRKDKWSRCHKILGTPSGLVIALALVPSVSPSPNPHLVSYCYCMPPCIVQN